MRRRSKRRRRPNHRSRRSRGKRGRRENSRNRRGSRGRGRGEGIYSSVHTLSIIFNEYGFRNCWPGMYACAYGTMCGRCMYGCMYL